MSADLIELLGSSPDGESPSGLFATVESEATGEGGKLTVETGTLTVRDGAQVSASTFGVGDAGDLSVQATELIEVSGTDPVDGSSSSLRAQVNSGAQGDGGNLTVETGQLLVRQGGQIAVSTFGTGMVAS